MQRLLVAIGPSAVLLMCMTSCRKNEDNQVKQNARCPLQVLQSVVRSVEHGSDSNNLSGATNRDSTAVVFTNGRISGLTTTSFFAQNGVQMQGVSRTVIFNGNKICVSYPSAATIHDTLMVDAAMHILERRHFDENAGCGSTSSSNWNYSYDAAGTILQATLHQFNDGIPSGTDTLRYTFTNGDLIKYTEDSRDNTFYDYYQDMLLPKDFMPYEQIVDGGAFTYRNTHLLATTYAPMGNSRETFTYLTDSTGKIVRVVAMLKYDGGAMSITNNYHYVCQ